MEAIRLWQIFPGDTIWISIGADLIGYSYAKDIHIVIEDCSCYKHDNKWYVHIYRVPEKLVYDDLLSPLQAGAHMHNKGGDVLHFYDTYFTSCKPKWPPEGYNEEKIFEDWVDFTQPHKLDISGMEVIE